MILALLGLLIVACSPAAEKLNNDGNDKRNGLNHHIILAENAAHKQPAHTRNGKDGLYKDRSSEDNAHTHTHQGDNRDETVLQ